MNIPISALNLPSDDPLVQMRERVIERLKISGAQSIPVGLLLEDPEVLIDVLTDAVVLQLRAFVYAERGEKATVRREVTVPSFPRWMPKWLRRKWSKVDAVTLDASPLLVYPDATLRTPELGAPVRLVQLGG